MYRTTIQSPEAALCHLFLHCCLKDGKFSETEMDDVSSKIVSFNLQHELNIKQELIHYNTYKDTISDEIAYLQFLVKMIVPTNDLALYSYCLELGLSDSSLDFSEKNLFKNLGEVLELTETEQSTIQKLMVQRKVVQTQQFF